MELNIEEVREYNQKLKEYKAKCQRLEVEADVAERDLLTGCRQLSQALGIEVTPENLEEVYRAQVEQLRTSLMTGKAVIEKIENSEKAVEQGAVQGATSQEQGTAPTLQALGTTPTPQGTPMPQATPIQVNGASMGYSNSTPNLEVVYGQPSVGNPATAGFGTHNPTPAVAPAPVSPRPSFMGVGTVDLHAFASIPDTDLESEDIAITDF